MTDATADFTHVSHKNQRPQRNRKGKGKIRERTVSERVSSRQAALDESGYILKCRELFRSALAGQASPSKCPPPACLVCLGLGSVADSTKSQDQYLLLRGLIEELNDKLLHTSTIYDPVFDGRDFEFFLQEGLEALRAEHDLKFSQTTFLYMPHCPRSLFEQLLRKNWSREKLSRLVILGNSLDIYDDPTHPSASTAVKSPFITKAASVFTIVPLPDTKQHLEAFNDLALQWVDPARLSSQEPSFWELEMVDTAAEAQQDGKSASSRRRDRTTVVEDEATVRRRKLESELIEALSRTSLE